MLKYTPERAWPDGLLPGIAGGTPAIPGESRGCMWGGP
jgi:hypothetical protein